MASITFCAFAHILSVVVRGKINAALSLPLDDIPANDSLASLLAIPHLNFFHVRDIVDVLSLTVSHRSVHFLSLTVF